MGKKKNRKRERSRSREDERERSDKRLRHERSRDGRSRGRPRERGSSRHSRSRSRGSDRIHSDRALHRFVETIERISQRSESASGGTSLVEQTLEKVTEVMGTLAERSTSRAGHRGIEGKLAIPIFDPSDKHQSVETWIQKVEDLKEMHGWDNTTVSSFMTDRLRGLARTWYDGLPTVAMQWAEWKEKVIAAFTDRTCFPDRLAAMLARSKFKNESMTHYFFEKAALVNACGFEGQKAAECIVHGINNSAIQAVVKMKDFRNPEELRDLLGKFDSDVGKHPDGKGDVDHKEKHRSTGGHKNGQFKQHETDERPGPSGQTTYPQKKGGLASVKCYNCNEKGHYSYHCPKPSTRTAGVKKILSIGSMPKQGGARFQDVLLQGTPMRAYIDLGSECVTLRKAEAEQLQLNLQPTETTLRGYGGGTVKPCGTAKVMLKVDLAEALVDVHVVPNDLQDLPLIVGQPFTDLPNITVLQRDGDLRLFETSTAILPEVVDLPPRKITLWAAKATVIPPNHAGNVRVIVKDNAYEGDLFVDLSLRGEENSEHCIPRCIINTSLGLLPIVNLSDVPLRISTSQVVARAWSAREETPFEKEERQVLSIKKSIPRDLPIDEIHVDDSVTGRQRSKLLSLLNRYRDCFAFGTSELGKTTAAEVDIELTSDKPVVYRPYRLSYAERGEVRKIVEDLKSNGIIQDSNSPFASPILLVRKKTGELRMCIDYRALNSVTRKDRYPLPLIEDQLNNLQGSTRFTSLDLASGYYQIPVSKNSVEKTSFVTPDGQYEFLRMPFGLANAPSVFQRMMNKVLAPLKNNNVMAYMDDILIPSRDVESGLRTLELVLIELRKANLTLKLSKCAFLETRIDYLGYEVTQHGVRPGMRKIEAVSNYSVPNNVHEVRRFVGLASYFRKFVKNFATIARPLTQLTKKSEEWKWGSEQQEAFEEIKNRLISRPVLALYDPQAETELHTDASKWGFGGILMQKQTKEVIVFKPVAYFSRQTTKEEQRYHSYELETLAVISSLHRFRVYLLGIKFKIISDCSALRETFVKRDLLPRIGRWWIQLQEYSECSIEYRPGTKMSHVDALSRNAISDIGNQKSIEDVGLLHIEQDDWLLTAQLQDRRLSYIHEVLQREPVDSEERSIKQEYVLRNNRVFRKTTDGERWAVPRSSRREIVRTCHDDIGHFGIDKTLSKVRLDYWFPSMRQYIKRYVNSCLGCLYNKEPAGKKAGFLHPIEKSPTPMHTVHIDHLGPFVRSTARNAYLLVLVDAFTKFVFTKAVPSTKTLFVERSIDDVGEIFGFPSRLISDRGSAFTSKRFKEYCRALGIQHVLTAVATPRANGQVERYNRSILNALSASITDERKWDKEITKVKWGLNNTVNKATGKSPTELLLGYRPRGATEVRLLNEIGNPSYDDDLESTREKANQVTRAIQAKQKERYDRKRAPPKQFKVDDIVVVRRVIANNDGASKKLLPKYAGPYVIKKVLDKDRFLIEDIKGAQRTQKPYSGVVPGDKLKRWNTTISDSEESTESDSDGDVPRGATTVRIVQAM